MGRLWPELRGLLLGAPFKMPFSATCQWSFPVALCVWGVVTLDYFCKPYEERQRRPRSYGPACASLVTASVTCALCRLVHILKALASS